MPDGTIKRLNVPSPCTGVCRLEPKSGLCEGCLRTAEEIGEWPSAAPARKLDILEVLKARRRAAGRTSAADARERRRSRRR